jgi:hypothetical protein
MPMSSNLYASHVAPVACRMRPSLTSVPFMAWVGRARHLAGREIYRELHLRECEDA